MSLSRACSQAEGRTSRDPIAEMNHKEWQQNERTKEQARNGGQGA